MKRSLMNRRGFAYSRLTLALSIALSSAVLADPLPLANPDFSNPANNGTIGGGLLGDSGASLIGEGPWGGRYEGYLDLLAPPTLTIGNGTATISQLGVGTLGMANSGAFVQDTGAAVLPQQHYVLAADIGAQNALTLDLLGGGNAGVALEAGGFPLASSQTAPDVGVTAARHGRVHVALGYDSAAGDSGSVGAVLFANPTGVLAVDLLSTVSFDNTALTAAALPAAGASGLAPAVGTPQAATIDTDFSAPLVVSVTDGQGNPLEGVTVTFQTPSSGAGAVLSSSTAVTDVGGRAQVDAHANGMPGSYVVTAQADGVEGVSQFALTNSGSGAPTVTSIAGGNQGQAQTVLLGFECRLSVQVFNGSEPAAGATVVFDSPSSGASALLTDSTSSGTHLTETTDDHGLASVIATASATPGSYGVTATLTSLGAGLLATPVPVASYPMTNLAIGDRIFANGFEDEPALCGDFVN